MRIGVNALYLIPGGVGGTEIYLRSLLPELARIDSANDYFVFTNRETEAGFVPAAPNFHQAPQPVHAVSRPVRILWEQLALPVAAERLKLDVILNAGFTAPLLCPCPQVTVFHDLQHMRHPEYFRWFDLPFWKFFLYWAAHVSAMVIAISEATGRDLRAYYRLPERKLRVIVDGVDPVCFELAARRAPERFLLTVSTLHPHKNIERLLEAFAWFRKDHPDFRLIVCGMHGLHTDAAHALREKFGLRDSVDFPGWIPREDLYDLYRRAWAFIYPSLFEGFGLPIGEALAAGIPTACSDIDPLTALAGEAAVRFDPRDTGAIHRAMESIVTDVTLRADLSVRGPRQAAKFQWTACAQATLAALRESIQVSG